MVNVAGHRGKPGERCSDSMVRYCQSGFWRRKEKGDDDDYSRNEAKVHTHEVQYSVMRHTVRPVGMLIPLPGRPVRLSPRGDHYSPAPRTQPPALTAY